MGGLLCPATATVHGGFKGKSGFFQGGLNDAQPSDFLPDSEAQIFLPLSQMY